MAITKIITSLSPSVERLACKQTRIRVEMNIKTYIGILYCIIALGCNDGKHSVPEASNLNDCIPIPKSKPLLGTLVDTFFTEKISEDCIMYKQYIKGHLWSENIGHVDSAGVYFDYLRGHIYGIDIRDSDKGVTTLFFYKGNLISVWRRGFPKDNFEKIMNDSLHVLWNQHTLHKE